MPKKVQYTQITPIPHHVPRQLAIDMLHSHGEIIELNPLVLEHHPIKAPRDAPADEFFSVWHEITERIQYVPGMGKMGSGKINFKGVFHDMPWGLQTHIYAPAGVETRNKWQIRGNQPGEPPEPRELGSAAPSDGLYLREDVEIKCNFTMVPFVKSANKAASKVLVDRLIKKAELIDAEILRQMMESNRHDNNRQSQYGDSFNSSQGGHSPQPPQSPGMSPAMNFSPTMSNPADYKRNTMLSNSEVLRKREEQMRQSMYSSSGSFRGQPSPNLNHSNTYSGQPSPGLRHPSMNEMMGDVPRQQAPATGLAIEMMGDTQYGQQPQSSPNLYPPRQSTYSEMSSEHGGQGNSRQNSVNQGSGTLSSGWGGSQTDNTSPMPEQQQQQSGYRYDPRNYAQELPAQR